MIRCHRLLCRKPAVARAPVGERGSIEAVCVKHRDKYLERVEYGRRYQALPFATAEKKSTTRRKPKMTTVRKP